MAIDQRSGRRCRCVRFRGRTVDSPDGVGWTGRSEALDRSSIGRATDISIDEWRSPSAQTHRRSRSKFSPNGASGRSSTLLCEDETVTLARQPNLQIPCVDQRIHRSSPGLSMVVLGCLTDTFPDTERSCNSDMHEPASPARTADFGAPRKCLNVPEEGRSRASRLRPVTPTQEHRRFRRRLLLR